MSRIAVTCGDCDAKFNVKAELAGKRVKCPTCGTVVRVVAAEDEDDELPPPTPVRKSASKSKAKTKSESKPLLTRILTTAALTLLVIAGLGLRVWSRVNRIQERNAARQQNVVPPPPQPSRPRPVSSSRPLVATPAPTPDPAATYTTPATTTTQITPTTTLTTTTYRIPGSSLSGQTGSVAPAATNASQPVRIVTTGKPPLAVELELPAGWTPMGVKGFQRPGQPLVNVTVLGSGSLPAESAAKLFIRGLLPTEATPEAVTVGQHSGKRQLLKSLEASGGIVTPNKGVNYLFDLPDGGVVLAFRSSEALQDADHALFEKIASSLKVTKAADEGPTP